MDEIWKQIPNHEGYEASNLGRIRSVDRHVTTKLGHSRFRKGQILKANVGDEGARSCDRYPHVMLGRGRMRRVHQLIAWTFIGPQPSGLYVCHDDGDRENNRDTNLYYGTAQRNQIDRHRHGMRGFGENHPNAKLTCEKVKAIRRRIANGDTQSAIAADYDIDQASISNIKTGARWAHVQD